MKELVYRYSFDAEVPMEEVESMLLLAIFAAQSLHGEVQVRLDCAHYLDMEKRACVIDAKTQVGMDVNRLFTGLFTREFGPDSFKVERLDAVPEQPKKLDPERN